MKDLVLLHAAASSPATWDALTPPLAELGYRVHTPTLLGHAGAERRRTYALDAFRDDVLSQLDHLDEFALVGNSLGAFIASAIAIEHPTRVTRLVLEELPVPPRNAADHGPSRKATPTVVLNVLGLLARGCDHRVLRDVVTALRQPNPAWWEGLTKVPAPTLLLAGGPTSHLDQSRFPLVAAALPTATITEIPAGHRIHTKAPTPWLTATTPHLT
ncbi:alpha/beta fold hydrolase [Kribbella sp. NPDC058245]|uniref:alpha/beta fold hydrolase n=1 Tax=Kribbella sp. NPDC058245 TaxID=3346399 RepID=UPI0036DFCD85